METSSEDASRGYGQGSRRLTSSLFWKRKKYVDESELCMGHGERLAARTQREKSRSEDASGADNVQQRKARGTAR